VQQLPTESHVFEGEVRPATERTDQPAEEMPERHDHGKNFSGKDRIKLYGQVIDFAGVRPFGEAQHTDHRFRDDGDHDSGMMPIAKSLISAGVRPFGEALSLDDFQKSAAGFASSAFDSSVI